MEEARITLLGSLSQFLPFNNGESSHLQRETKSYDGRRGHSSATSIVVCTNFELHATIGIVEQTIVVLSILEFPLFVGMDNWCGPHDYELSIVRWMTAVS